MIIDPKFTKPVDSVVTTQSETSTRKTVNSTSLLYTLCDRDNTADKKGNYFVSFNLPTTADDLSTGSTVSLLRPELQQLNVDQIIFAKIPSESYSELIHGGTITWKVPQGKPGGTQSSMSSITLYSSTFSSDKVLRNESDPLLGDNIVFLFSDEIGKPFSGVTVNEIGQYVSHSGNTTWEPDATNFLKRPSAVTYKEVEGAGAINGINSDSRTPWLSVRVPSGYPYGRSGHNYDIPVGFVVLDKGYMVITHTGITANFPWGSGFTETTNTPATSTALSARTNIFFTGTTDGSTYVSNVTYTDLNTSFKSSVVCIAKPREFYISNNPTWNREKAITEMNAQDGVISLDPLYVTEVNLVNALGEIVAVAKFSNPIEKTYISLLTFNVDIEM